MIQRKKIILVTGAVILSPVLMLGQILGIPTIVWDPAQDAHMVTQIANDARMLEQAIQTYRTITNTYNQIVANAVWLTNKNAWIGIATPIINSTTNSTFGETAGWNDALTQGLGVDTSWANATYAMNPAPFYSGFPVGQSSMSANIASVNVADGLSQAAMLTIANSRMNQPLNDTALNGLESDAQDTSDATNSEVGQLNIIANGAVLQNRQMEDQNALLTSIAEQQILTNKVTRDTISSSINVQSTRDNFIADEPTQWGGSAATIAGYQQ